MPIILVIIGCTYIYSRTMIGLVYAGFVDSSVKLMIGVILVGLSILWLSLLFHCARTEQLPNREVFCKSDRPLIEIWGATGKIGRILVMVTIMGWFASLLFTLV